MGFEMYILIHRELDEDQSHFMQATAQPREDNFQPALTWPGSDPVAEGHNTLSAVISPNGLQK